MFGEAVLGFKLSCVFYFSNCGFPCARHGHDNYLTNSHCAHGVQVIAVLKLVTYSSLL